MFFSFDDVDVFPIFLYADRISELVTKYTSNLFIHVSLDNGYPNAFRNHESQFCLFQDGSFCSATLVS